MNHTQTATFIMDLLRNHTQTATFIVDLLRNHTQTATFIVDLLRNHTQTDTFIVDLLRNHTQTACFAAFGVGTYRQSTCFAAFGVGTYRQSTCLTTVFVVPLLRNKRKQLFLSCRCLGTKENNCFCVSLPRMPCRGLQLRRPGNLVSEALPKRIEKWFQIDVSMHLFVQIRIKPF